LKNEKNEDVDVCTLTVEKGLVLFLVPKADTRKLFPCPFSATSERVVHITSRMHNTGLWIPGYLS
jgi:hypothetical protein